MFNAVIQTVALALGVQLHGGKLILKKIGRDLNFRVGGGNL